MAVTLPLQTNTAIRHTILWSSIATEGLYGGIRQPIYSIDFQNTYYHLDRMHVRRKNPLFNDTVQVSVELYQSFDSAQSNYVSASGLLGTNKGTIRTKRKRTTKSEEAKRKLESTFLFGIDI